MVAACGYQHIRMYDLGSVNPDPVLNFDGVSKNISRVGFQVYNIFIIVCLISGYPVKS